MTTAQVFQESLKTTIFGMCLVLGTLYVLSLILDLMRVIFAPAQKKSNTEIKEPIIEHTQTDTGDDTELIAVITAAIAQYLQTPLSSIKVGAIRKIHEKTPIWGMSSRMYNINNKL